MRLIIEDDSGRRTVVPFAQDEISIGREGGNTVRLDERNVSRRHAVLTRRDGRVIIEDLGSFNGVRINGDRIQGKLEVGEGDIIQIGDYDLAIEDEAKASLPERPTQPELAANDASAEAVDEVRAQAQLEALARMQKAAAIQAALSKGKPRDERDTDPKQEAVTAETPWPPEFHRFEPPALAAARAKARLRRMLRVGLPVIIGVAAVAVIVHVRAPRPRAEAPAQTAAPSTPVAPTSESAAPVPNPEPPAVPAAAAPVIRSAPPRVAVASAPTPVPATSARASKAAAREKARDLYQDAVADVGNGDYPAAMSKLQEALRLDPALPEAHKELAICYSHLNQPDKGALHYQRYLELAPQAPDADDVRKMLADYRAARGQ